MIFIINEDLLNEDEVDISTLAQKDGNITKFNGVLKELTDARAPLEDTQELKNILSDKLGEDALGIADDLIEQCKIAVDAQQSYNDRNNAWNKWANQIENNKQKLLKDPEMYQKAVKYGEGVISAAGKGDIYTAQQLKDMQEFVKNCYAAISSIFKKLPEDDAKRLRDSIMPLYNATDSFFEALRTGDASSIFDTQGQLEQMARKLRQMRSRDLSGLEGDDDEQDPQTPGEKANADARQLIARIKLGKYSAQDEDALVDLLEQGCSGANTREDFRALLPSIILSIQRDGMDTNKNLLLRMVLTSDTNLGRIGTNAFSNLLRYIRSETNDLTVLDQQTVNEKTTPWLYSPGYYVQFSNYDEFRNATQSFELLRHKERVQKLLGFTKDENGNPISEKLICTGNSPTSLKILPLGQINALINNLRKMSKVSTADLSASVKTKEGSKASSNSVKLTDTQINNAKKYVSAIENNASAIEALPKELKDVLEQAKIIFNKAI